MSQENVAVVRRRRGRGILAILAVVGLGVSCGGSADERAVEDTVYTFVDAIGDDGEKTCLQLSREAQARLMRHQDKASCERAAESATRPDIADYDFGAIRFGPGNESARVPSILSPEYLEEAVGDIEGLEEDLGHLGISYSALFPPIPLEEGDSRWRITGLDWYFGQ
jgi:hypothetical protein